MNDEPFNGPVINGEKNERARSKSMCVYECGMYKSNIDSNGDASKEHAVYIETATSYVYGGRLYEGV